MALVQGSGAGGGTGKKKKKKKHATNQKGRYYPPQKSLAPKRDNPERPAFVPYKPEQVQAPKETPLMEASMGARYDPRVAPAQTEEGETEKKVKSITDSYFKMNKAMPDPVSVAQLMMDKRFAPRSPELYDALWEPIMESIDKETPYLKAGDFFAAEDSRQTFNALADAAGIMRDPRTNDTRNAPASDVPKIIFPDVIKEQLDYLSHFKRSRYASQDDFLMASGEVSAYRKEMYDRTKRRGDKPRFDEYGTEYDPDFELAVRRAIFGRQLAYAFGWGSDVEKMNADEIIRMVRKTGYGSDRLEKMAHQLGLPEGTDLSSVDKVSTLLGALQVDNSELLAQIAWDGWSYGRPVGQSTSQARREFAATFGINRLPADQLAKYNEENGGLLKIIGDVAGEAGDAWNWVKNVPVVGDILAPIGYVAGKVDNILFAPIQYSMRGITTLGDVWNMADRGMSIEEYQQELIDHKGAEGFERQHHYGFDWGELTDMSNWARGWEYAEGNTPLSVVAANWDLQADGKAGAAATQMGQLADFAVMMYVGAKADSLMWGNKVPEWGNRRAGIVPAVGARTWEASRATHKLGWQLYNFKLKKLTTGNQGGYILISSPTAATRKAELNAAGLRDPGRPTLVEGYGTLLSKDGKGGTFVRIVKRTSDPEIARRRARETALRKGANTFKDGEFTEDVDELEKAIKIGDREASRGDWADVGDDEYIVRPLTYDEFMSVEPPIRGAVYHGGKFGFDPHNSRYKRYMEGRGLYVTDDVYMGGEYSHGFTSGEVGKLYYIDGKPKNAIDFDAPADAEMWQKIFDDILFVEPDGTARPRITDGTWKGELSEDTTAWWARMEEDTGWQKGIEEPEAKRTYLDHRKREVETSGPVTNGEVFKWFMRNAPSMAGGRKMVGPDDFQMQALRIAQKMQDAVQSNLFRRGFDAQTHREGRWRGDEHNVTVFFDEGLRPQYAQRSYQPGRLLGDRARMRLINQIYEYGLDYDMLPAPIAERMRKLDEMAESITKDKGAFVDTELWGIATDTKLWDDLKYVGARVEKGDAGDALVHRFTDQNGKVTRLEGDVGDLDGVPGALKHNDNVRMLDDDEAYQRYLEDFENDAIQQADDVKSPVNRSPLGSRTAKAMMDDIAYEYDSLDYGNGRLIYRSDYGEVSIKHVNAKQIEIHSLGAFDDAPEGAGGMLLDELLARADANGVTVKIPEVTPFKRKGFRNPLSQADTEAFYSGRGFRPGKNGTWVREPVMTGTRIFGDQSGKISIEMLGSGLIHITNTTKGGNVLHQFQHYTPPKWLATNAELLERVDDPYSIVKMYGIAEDIDEVKPILRKIADSKDKGEIQVLLRELEAHGIEIDGGAAAGIKAMRHSLMQRGIGDVGWSRVFSTMTTYGKTQPIEHTSESIGAVGAAIRMGTKDKKRTLQQLRRLEKKAWEAAGNDKQAVVDEMWDLFERNMGPEEMAKLQKYHQQVYHARGQKYIQALRRRAYMNAMKDGQPQEVSLVVPPHLRKELPEAQLKALDKFHESHAAYSKDLEAEVLRLEKEMMRRFGSTNPRKGSRTSGDYRRKKKELDELNRLSNQALHPDVVIARKEIAALAAKLGANEADLSRLADAVREATRRTQKHADAAAVLERLGGKSRLKKAEKAEFDQAIADMEEFRSAQPFKLGQARQNIVHRYDPRIVGWYMSGTTVRDFMLFDQAVMEPLIRMFKETVMSTLGFPIRVNIGDETIRLIPEGVFSRYFRSRDRRNIRQTVINELGDERAFDGFDSQLHQAISSDLDTTGNPDDWTVVLPHEEGYHAHLKDDLDSWSREMIVQRLINDKLGGVGNMPTDPKQIRRFINRLRDETDANGNPSEDALAVRRHLQDTHRSDERWVTRDGQRQLEDVFDTRMYNEWVDAYAERLAFIAENQTLRRAMTDNVSVDELVEWTNGPGNGKAWPVNAPAKRQMDFSLRSGNPLYILPYLNQPFHTVYQYGTVKLLEIIGEKTKTALFNDRYYRLRTEILDKHPGIDPRELHRLCAEDAVKYANRSAYSKSTTMFEDMSRNLLPFVSAYRQFWIYWGATAMKHPFSMSVARQAYPEAFKDPFRYASGDWQFLMPQIPFWGPQPEDDSKGLWSLMKNQLPSASMFGVVPARGLITLSGGNPEDYADLPFLTALDHSYAPYKRQAQLLYGLGAPAPPDELGAIFGDPAKLEKAHINAVLSWLNYGASKTGPEVQYDMPWWAEAISKLPWTTRPEAIANEFAKTFGIIGAYYSPEEVRNRQNTMERFRNAKTPLEKAAVRASDPWFDGYISYYEASEAEKQKMRLDPANAKYIKWWASPYDYDLVGDVIDPNDFAEDMFTEGRKPKQDVELGRYIHNMYTDIFGGTYLKLQNQQGLINYQGDVSKQKADKAYQQRMKDALSWAKETAKAYSEKFGYDYADLMYRFNHAGNRTPDGRWTGWGIWNDIVRRQLQDNPDKTMYDYNIQYMANQYQKEWPGMSLGQLKTDKVPRSQDDVIKGFGLLDFIPDKRLADKMRQEAGGLDVVKKSRKELKQEITKVTTQIASDQWYYITAEQLNAIGIKADPRINKVQLDLKLAWKEWHKAKAGSDEYRAGRNSYYAMQEKLLGGLEGGKALVGGIADRLEHIPHFTEPRVITIGTGRQAAKQQAKYDDYLTVRNAELKKGDPDIGKIQAAWKRFVGDELAGKGDPKIEYKVAELARVRFWHYVLEESTRIRKILKNSHSDYYEAKGNSVTSQFGKKYANELNSLVNQIRKVNKGFDEDIERYFGGSDNVGAMLIDWYNY